MQKPLERGNFVVNDGHPEHGLGRVLATGGFATRVLFQSGGLRVFRANEPNGLRAVFSPPSADVDALAAKEAALSQGVVDAPMGEPKPAPAKKPAGKKPKKATPT